MICTNTLNNLSRRYVPMVEPLRRKGYADTVQPTEAVRLTKREGALMKDEGAREWGSVSLGKGEKQGGWG